MKRTGNISVETINLAIESVNSIKKDMLKSGNHISRIVYNIKDALKEREACKKFALSTGMSKASISKMLTAETLRDNLSISHEVSYNNIYKVKNLLDIDKVTSDMVVAMLNDGKTENDIRLTLIKSGHSRGHSRGHTRGQHRGHSRGHSRGHPLGDIWHTWQL